MWYSPMTSEERTCIFSAFLAAHQKNFACGPDHSLLIIILISVNHTLLKSNHTICTNSNYSCLYMNITLVSLDWHIKNCSKLHLNVECHSQ